MDLEDLIVKLFKVDGLKFGRFEMRNGEVTPVYIDMRVIWHYPDITKAVCDHIWKKLESLNIPYDQICGLPYQGIPIASHLSLVHNIPMLLKRQSAKSYGTMKLFEGHYKEGDKIAILDDVIMTGGTIVDDIPSFRGIGVDPVCCVAFIDRNQGGIERVEKNFDTKVYSVCTMMDVFEILLKHKLITQDTVDTTTKYLQANQFTDLSII